MTILALTGDRNHRRVDYTGAFRPESRAFAQHHGAVIRAIDLSLSEIGRRKAVYAAIDAVKPTALAIFCHGYVSGLQLGVRRVHARELAARLSAHGCSRVVLYACSTGGGPGYEGDGGFADRLRDELCRAGERECVVDAHDRAGHTTRLPYVRRFEGRGSPVGGTGGSWLVEPRSQLWRPWVLALRDTDLRFRFPLLTIAEVHLELLKAAKR